jgi:hypothetical protein
MAVFITVRPGVSNAAALRSLDHITAVLNRTSDPDGPVGGVVSALRQVEIANYRTVGTTPAVLAAVLATGALAALGLTLVASVRQRRRQFAVLKALGFTQRLLAATVAWQSSVAPVVGVVVGVPAGIALGRWMWTVFADGISAVPHPIVPALHCAGRARRQCLREPRRPLPRARRRPDPLVAAAAGRVSRGHEEATRR